MYRYRSMKYVDTRFHIFWVPALLIALALFVSACGGGEATATPVPPTAIPVAKPTASAVPTSAVLQVDESPTAEPETPESSQVESPLSSPDSPLSSPPSPLAPPLPTPAVSAEGGGLTGQIIVTRPTGDVVVSGLIVGLAEVILDENGQPKASGYESAVAPKATTDDFGRFVFDNVRPGMYTLILDAVVTQYQLENAETGETILIEISPNSVADLGELRYPSLPIPGFQ